MLNVCLDAAGFFYYSDIFIWVCKYQFLGEKEREKNLESKRKTNIRNCTIAGLLMNIRLTGI